MTTTDVDTAAADLAAALIAPPAPGIYPDTPMPTYLLWDAVNNSRLSDLKRSPNACRWKREHPEEWPREDKVSECQGTAFGTAVHLACLQPEDLHRTYRVVEGNWTTKAPKDQVAAIREAGQIPVKPEVWAALAMIRHNVWNHPVARKLVAAAEARELSFVWDDDETGLRCKGRADFMGAGVVSDIKTTRDAAGFAGAVATYAYYRSVPFYLDGLQALGQRAESFAFVAIENVPPYEVSVHELDPGAVELGRAEYQTLLRRYLECERSGNWPIRSSSIETVFLKPYHADQIQEGTYE